MKIKEVVEYQPDLADQTIGTFNIDGEDVTVNNGQSGNKEYRFSPKVSDYIASIDTDPDTQGSVLNVLSNAYINNDEFYQILQYANREDVLLFTTSNGDNLKINMNDVLKTAHHLEREEYFTKKKEGESIPGYFTRMKNAFGKTFGK